MRREYLAGVSAFAAVATHKSFTGAAAQLGLSPSAVSHAVRALETRLGLRLLNRSTRSVALTEAGETYLARVTPALEQLAAAADGLDELHNSPAGRLRINLSRPAYWAVLAPRVVAFRHEHPQVELDLVIDDELADIVAEGCDAGIRLGETLQQDMVAVAVSAPLELVVCASPEYFAQHARPLTPADLQQHRCLGFRYSGSGVIYCWELERDGRQIQYEPDGITVNDGMILRHLVKAGMGLACIMSDIVRDDVADGSLIRVLDDWCAPFPGYFLYYASHRHVPAKLRALIDSLKV